MLIANEFIALEVNGQQISLDEVLALAKMNGRLELFHEAIDATLIRQEATLRGVTVLDEELQRAADDFRVANELHDAAVTEQWLTAHYLTHVDWEFLIEEQTIAEKLRRVLTSTRTEQYFAENRLSFDSAFISRLVLKEEEVSRELRAQIVEEGADFHALARLYSIDINTKLAGGYAGRKTRADLQPAVEAAVFGAQPQALVGPFKDELGWELIKVESLHPAMLDDSLRETISQKLFHDWLSEQRRKARISVPLLNLSPSPEEDGESEQHERPGLAHGKG